MKSRVIFGCSEMTIKSAAVLMTGNHVGIFIHRHKIQDLPLLEFGKLVGIASLIKIRRAFLTNWLTSTLD